jgi:hypothetical protein
MLLRDKNSLRDLRQVNVSAEMAGTFVGLIFGGLSLFACLSALWMGNQSDDGAVHFFAIVSIVLFAIAGISIISRILQLDSAEKRVRLLVGLVLGFVILSLDILSMVFFEMKLQGFLGSAVFLLHAVVGVGCLGMFTMARAFAK